MLEECVVIQMPRSPRFPWALSAVLGTEQLPAACLPRGDQLQLPCSEAPVTGGAVRPGL